MIDLKLVIVKYSFVIAAFVYIVSQYQTDAQYDTT